MFEKYEIMFNVFSGRSLTTEVWKKYEERIIIQENHSEPIIGMLHQTYDIHLKKIATIIHDIETM